MRPTLKPTLKHLVIIVAMSIAAIVVPATSSRAAVITIELEGLDVHYTGTDLFSGPDPLSSVRFFLDGTLLGSFTSDVYADFGVFAERNIPVGGGSVTWALPGTFDVFSPTGGWELGLDLSSLSVTYDPTASAGAPALTGRASVDDVAFQLLPFGLIVGQPIEVMLTFGTLSNLTQSGGFLTGFDASGTAAITAAAVPEPTSLLLLGTGVAALIRSRVRRRR